MKVNHPFILKSNYLIRTVTMIYTGKLEAVYDKELVISSASWIAETKRWATSVKTGEFEEVEPYPDDCKVTIGRGSIIDATPVNWKLPREQK
jgi:hypothetical protein